MLLFYSHPLDGSWYLIHDAHANAAGLQVGVSCWIIDVAAGCVMLIALLKREDLKLVEFCGIKLDHEELLHRCI